MTISPQLEARLGELMRRYPAGYSRAALVPMLLYAQDETGRITEELVEEIASRLQITALEVNEVVSYYSMLRRRLAGRHHVQICTNISCLLQGAEQLYRHAQSRLTVGPRQVSADGLFSLEEVECIGACCWAPAIQVNYQFHHRMTPEKFDALVEELRGRG